MLNTLRRCRTFISILLLVSATNTLVRGQDGSGRRPNAEQIQQAAQIEQQSGNGIFVDDPKVYDDSSLQLMLNAARARLAAIQAIDQTGLLNRIGNVTGASLSQSSLGVSIMGPPIPQSVVTENGATGSTTTNANGTSTTSTLPVQNTVTTNPALTATAPAAPANGGVTLPSTNGISALDALNEQMQLTYEIANLQLLLEGSLNDRFVKGQRFIKPRATLGFPITITPQARYKNAVAVVEVEAENPAINFNPDDRPAVTALLPREKTYNVAALTDHMTSIGGGLVTQVVSGGFSLLRGRKSYYIVQDQDTLAVMQPGSDARKTAFSWQFRPVLGQSYVRSGLKQTFVQLSVPLKAASGCFGKIKVRTYWRRIDRKTGVLKEVIPESISSQKIQPIPVFDLAPIIEKDVDYDDLGAGQIRVTITGKFLSGTYIRVGNNYYREGSPGFTSELTQIRFVASAAEVAKYKAFIVSRDGTETRVIDAGDPEFRAGLPLTCSPADAPPDTSYGFGLSAARPDQTVSPGETARFTVTVATASGFSSPIVLTQSGLPTVVGRNTGWSAGRVTPAANSSVTSIFTVETTAMTEPGNYDIQLFGNAGSRIPVQSVNVKLHVLSRMTPPPVAAKVFAFDDSRSVVEATLTNMPANPEAEKYLMVINNRVFGLADAPIERRPDKAVSDKWVFRAIVPNSLLNGAPKLEVKPLFWKDEYTATVPLETASLDNLTYKVAVMSQTVGNVTFLLYGSRLTEDSIKNPTGIKLYPVGDIDPKTLRTFTLTKEQWGGLKQIVLRHSANDRPVFVDIPQPEGPPKITLTAGGRVVVGTEEVTVTGYTFDEKLKSVVCSTCSGKPKIDYLPEGKSVKLRGLVGARVTSIAGEPEIQFEFEDGKKLTLKLDVVTSKVEEVTRDKPQP
jgi:hypothetical protein